MAGQLWCPGVELLKFTFERHPVIPRAATVARLSATEGILIYAMVRVTPRAIFCTAGSMTVTAF